MQHIFLESHNIDNLHFGFGQYNYHLIKALHTNNAYKEFDFTINAKNSTPLRKEFGSDFCYKRYTSLQRHKPFRIKKKYDLWHSLNQNTKIEPFFDIPYLMTVHDVNFMEESKGRDLEKRERNFKEKIARSNALVYISNYAKEMTHRYFDIPKIPEYIIYNGNPAQDILISKDHQPTTIPDSPFIFFVGEFQERKNIHTLVEMLQFLPDISLILAGKNTSRYADEIRVLLNKLHLNNRVYLPGKISELDKQYYYKHCLAFGFPSLREGFGIPPIEAMTFGKPVFLSNKSSLPEIGGAHAFYWKDFDPKTMATVFENGINEYERHKTSYATAYKKHAASFDWTNTASAYIKVYQELSLWK